MYQLLCSKQCRKKKIQTLVLILVIVLIYFLLQFFTMSKLGSVSGRKQETENLAHLELNDEKGSPEDRSKEAESHENVNNFKFKPENGEVEENRHPVTKIIPRGVHPSDADHYAEHAPGMFKCLESGALIPMSRVNDDFCDCADSSDEPGSSACPHSRFYCQVQLPHRDAQFVPSSQVNDGLCDCCDGSDEWQEGRHVPSFMQLEGRSGAVFHAPCTDRCGDVEKVLEQERKIRSQGLKLQGRYITAAKKLPADQRQKYGTAGIFYLLSQHCWEHKTGVYVYTVCPFKTVHQGSVAGARQTSLGRGGKWTRGKGAWGAGPQHVLTMAGGDASLCPRGETRQTQVRFLCGLEDRVIDVQEDEKCRYAVRFSSPAAC